MNSGVKAWIMTAAFAVVSFLVFLQVFHNSSLRSTSSHQTESATKTRDAPSVTADLPHRGQFRVTNIHEGDTCDVVGSDGIQFTIRLAGIDAPELAQDYGHTAKDTLLALIGTQTVSLSEIGKDKYGRHLAQVYCDKTWVNKEMLLRGAAWAYLAGSHFDEFKNAQTTAKNKRLGLWSSNDPRPPWEARR
jgi:micrococcal nuclease